MLPGVYSIRRGGGAGSCRGGLRFLQWEVRIGGKTHVRRTKRQTEAAARTKSAARGPKISGEHTGAAAAHSGGVHQSAGAAEDRGDRRHDRDVRVGEAGFARSGGGALDAIERQKSFEPEQRGESETPRSLARREKRTGNVTLLRGSAATGAQDNDVVAFARAEAAAICNLLRGRAGNHGSGEPRGLRSRWKIHRAFHRAAAR